MLHQAAKHSSRSVSVASLLPLLAIVALGPACGPLDPEDAEKQSGVPVASFDQNETQGNPGLVVQFSDTSTGNVSSYMWDFGALGTSSEQNPLIQFDAVGSYSVALTVSGPSGTSTVRKDQLISVDLAVVADFSCTPTLGYSPLAVACTDASIEADSWLWSFGDGQTSTDQDPVHVYTGDGPFIVQLTAFGPGGSDTHSDTIDARLLEIVLESGAPGPAPVDATFIPDTKGMPANLFEWLVDGQQMQSGSEARFIHRFPHPGTFKVKLTTLYLTIPPIPGAPLYMAEQEIDFVVSYSEAAAEFAPSVSGGSGPLSVQLMDESTGELATWEWVFGDGKGCTYPNAPSPPVTGVDKCTSSSPMHTYEEFGRYDVELTVTGPAADPIDPDVVDTRLHTDAVRVYIVDPSFEQQTANVPVTGPWAHLRPADELAAAEHLTLTGNQGADGGMPSDGQKWASLDGLGTDGSTAVEDIENGIRQRFMHPPGQPVLEFDYMLLYAEPPASSTRDAIVATVCESAAVCVDSEMTCDDKSAACGGAAPITIPSSLADPSTPYAGQSTRYPDRDGGIVRATPRITASINLTDAFPGSDDESCFCLTIRTANAVNERRSPRAYVDNVRFATPVAALPVDFTVATDPIVAGRDASFVDESCTNVDTDGNCLDAVSWLWDFGTHGSASPPTSTGSADQNPTYAFAETGDHDVTLIARHGDAGGTVTKTVTVLEPPLADFAIVSPAPPYTAPVDLVFEDRSTSDPLDPIALWSWDFGGWGTSTQQNPAPVGFLQTGDFLVRLTVTTVSGYTSMHEMTVTTE